MPSTPSAASGNPEGSRGSSPCALPSPSTRRRDSLCRLARAFKSRRAMKTTVPVVQGAAKALRFFDHIAPWYDRINARIYKRRWLERVRSEIHGLRVLDVGVGTGFTTGHLTASVGIDLSREMLKRARYQGHLIRADVMHPPFRPGVLITIIFAGSFYILRRPEAASTLQASRFA